MHVGSVGFHGCIRQLKQAMGLQGMGVKVHLVDAFVPEVFDTSGFSSVSTYYPLGRDGRTIDARQLQETVELLDAHVDLWHVHNEPNWIFRVVREITRKPVVWDIHDWTSLRKDPVPSEVTDEAYAIENADAFVVPSRGYLAKIRARTKKPTLLIYSKVPAFLFPDSPWPKKPGLVYEGGVRGKDKDFLYNYEYRNWADFLKKSCETLNGNKIYIYSANGGDDFGDYDHEKISLQMPLRYDAMLQAVAQHSVGLVGSPYPLPDFEDSMPNKLFEYIAAGIPVIVLNAPEAAKFVEEQGLGLSIRDASEVGPALERLTEHNVQNERWRYSLDGDVPAIISLYEGLTGARKRIISQLPM